MWFSDHQSACATATSPSNTWRRNPFGPFPIRLRRSRPQLHQLHLHLHRSHRPHLCNFLLKRSLQLSPQQPQPQLQRQPFHHLHYLHNNNSPPPLQVRPPLVGYQGCHRYLIRSHSPPSPPQATPPCRHGKPWPCLPMTPPRLP
ncbi:hypothetical protein PS2_004196 [Malus domestica]